MYEFDKDEVEFNFSLIDLELLGYYAVLCVLIFCNFKVIN